MLEDIEEVIEEAPLFVIGIIVGILILSIGGSMGYNYLHDTYYPKPPPVPSPIIITVTPSPTQTPTVKPSTTPAPDLYETITDSNNIPGATFKRLKTDPAGVYYGTYYNERAVYIDIEKWRAGGGRVVQMSGELPGMTIYTRFGYNVNSRYDEKGNIIFSLLEDPFKLYLDQEARGIKT